VVKAIVGLLYVAIFLHRPHMPCINAHCNSCGQDVVANKSGERKPLCSGHRGGGDHVNQAIHLRKRAGMRQISLKL